MSLDYLLMLDFQVMHQMERKSKNSSLWIHKKKPKKLTLWEDSVEHYGNELSEKVKDYPVFLARRVVKSSSRIWSRYNTTILLDPTYSEATTLVAWAKTIQ
ncbi:uncharacterized protein LOC132040194 [Lycium ferocissimum]|uniref:uncharacterized protein LOC132040194 n=1 Tax=Lycium ferocissimum TaxID=112874 RepID=UPI00281689C9|nr:uncharacterized protein LOC132040194 [Lycium ferocissimum]